MWPKISVVTPNYNKGQFLEETIRSVLLQGYHNLEYFIIDGGSTDDSIEIIRKYEKWLTYWISEPDRGQSEAINKGWEMAKGEILAYLNSDDTYTPFAVQTAVDYLAQNPDISMVYGDCNIIDEHSQVTGRYGAQEFDLRKMVCGHYMIPQQAVFFRRQILDSVGYLDVNLYMAMDLDLWLRIGLEFRIKYISKLIANFRVCPGTKCVEEGYKFEYDLFYTLNKLFSNPELPEDVRVLKRCAYSSVHLMSGMYYHSLGQMQKARRHLMKAFILHPPLFLKHPWLLGYLITSFLGANVAKTIVKWKRKLIKIH